MKKHYEINFKRDESKHILCEKIVQRSIFFLENEITIMKSECEISNSMLTTKSNVEKSKAQNIQ